MKFMYVGYYQCYAFGYQQLQFPYEANQQVYNVESTQDKCVSWGKQVVSTLKGMR